MGEFFSLFFENSSSFYVELTMYHFLLMDLKINSKEKSNINLKYSFKKIKGKYFRYSFML
jgi:hypothetical protein